MRACVQWSATSPPSVRGPAKHSLTTESNYARVAHCSTWNQIFNIATFPRFLIWLLQHVRPIYYHYLATLMYEA